MIYFIQSVNHILSNIIFLMNSARDDLLYSINIIENEKDGTRLLRHLNRVNFIIHQSG